MCEKTLPLGRARLRFFFEVHAELGLLGFAHAAFLFFTGRPLHGEPRFLLGRPARFLFFTSPPRLGFSPSPRLFRGLEPRFLFGCDSRFLNRVQLQELLRQ